MKNIQNHLFDLKFYDKDFRIHINAFKMTKAWLSTNFLDNPHIDIEKDSTWVLKATSSLNEHHCFLHFDLKLDVCTSIESHRIQRN